MERTTASRLITPLMCSVDKLINITTDVTHKDSCGTQMVQVYSGPISHPTTAGAASAPGKLVQVTLEEEWNP